MRVPKNITYIKDSSITEESIHFDDYEKLDYPFIEVSEANDKLIKKIEKIVRNSIEYREYINFLKDELDMNFCSFFQGLDYNNVTIEMHHVITLYDITSIVLNKKLTNEFNITPFDVAEEVMKLHYENKIALMPLSETIHELYHTGDIFIPITYSFGDYESFYNEYKAYMTSDFKNHYNNLIKLSKEYDGTPPEILQRKYTYITVDGLELPKKIKSILGDDICGTQKYDNYKIWK